METRELPVVAGHLALDFANTVDDPGGPAHHDHAGTYGELLAWSVRLGVLTKADATRLGRVSPRSAAAALHKARALRTTLQQIFTAVAHGERKIDWTALRPYVTDATAHCTLVPDGTGYVPSWKVDRPDSLLHPIAQAAYELLTGPDLARVKQCGGCPWVFLDRSRNGSRRWCAMGDCGTHAKIVKYVEKRAARRRVAG